MNIWHLILAVCVLGCKPQSAPKKKAAATNTQVPNNFWSGNQGTNSGFGSTSDTITISCTSALNNVLMVTLNQQHTWQFTASSSMGTATIQSITPSQQMANMQIASPTVTFTPQSVQELTGSLIVTAVGANGQSQQMTFTWQNSGTTNNNDNKPNFMSFIMAFLPSLLQGSGLNLGGLLGGLGGSGGLGGLGGGTTPNNYTPPINTNTQYNTSTSTSTIVK